MEILEPCECVYVFNEDCRRLTCEIQYPTSEYRGKNSNAGVKILLHMHKPNYEEGKEKIRLSVSK